MMPHKCLNCERVFGDEAEELITGCECGSKLFMYLKTADAVNESKDDSFLKKDTILREIDSFLQKLTRSSQERQAISFDLESIKVLEDGVYEINVKRLMEEVPLIVEFHEGAYRIHLASAFQKGRLERFSTRELEGDSTPETRKPLKKRVVKNNAASRKKSVPKKKYSEK